MNITYLADFTLADYYGGAEMVDGNICERLGIDVTKTSSIKSIDGGTHYILGNCLGLHQDLKEELIAKKNYSIFEHDYKIHPSRQPNRYKDNVFPKTELNTLYIRLIENAKNMYVQSKDHMDCHITNGVNANYVNLSTSIWSDDELDQLSSVSGLVTYNSHHFAIINSTVPEKGTKIAIDWCKSRDIDYRLIERAAQYDFYKDLARQPALVYFPIVKESFCRVVVEARAMYMNVLTTKNYGAVKEPWYSQYMGHNLCKFLKESSKKNIDLIVQNTA